MSFIQGYLGLATAVGTGTATEATGTGYARQFVKFSDMVRGVSVNSNAYNFGPTLGLGVVVGRAIFDRPVAGNLLLILPRSYPIPFAEGRADEGNVGYLSLNFSSLAALPTGGQADGAFLSGATLLLSASVLGYCYDQAEVIGTSSMAPTDKAGVIVIPQRSGEFLSVASNTMTAGVALSVLAGQLHAT